mgnify:FL=1
MLLNLFFLNAQATEKVRLGLLHNSTFRSMKIQTGMDEIELHRNGVLVKRLEAGSIIRIDKNGSTYRFYSDFEDFGEAQKFEIRQPKNKKSEYYLQVISPLSEKKWLNGNLFFDANEKFVLAILDVEDYVGGVVQAESGVEQGVEYYKVQAIISRTFYNSSNKKHIKEGFNMCDKTHCQVFHGLSKLSVNIQEGVRQTTGKVLVDSELRYIETVFHSNCGGATLNSEDYWGGNLPYLRQKVDSMCYTMPHATWQRTLPKTEWIGYLQRNHNFPTHDSAAMAWATGADYVERGKYYKYNNWHIPLRTIRKDWKLRSTFFKIEDLGQDVRFLGKGFGHGVGLCQEGAMVRARLAQSYSDILHFYYQDVYIVDKNMLSSLKSEF